MGDPDRLGHGMEAGLFQEEGHFFCDLVEDAQAAERIAVPICTAHAPAMMYSKASRPDPTQPTPITGMCTFSQMSYTARTPIDRIAGPLRPPYLFARAGIFSSAVIAIAFSVLIATM